MFAFITNITLTEKDGVGQRRQGRPSIINETEFPHSGGDDDGGDGLRMFSPAVPHLGDVG